MPLSLDPEIAAALQKMMGDAPPPKPPAPGAVAGRRAMFDSWMRLVSSMLPKVTDVTTHDFPTKSADGTPVKLRWYEKDGGAKGPAVLYLHGGGMILGSVDTYDSVVRNYVSQSSVPMLSVDYRLAPESPHPMPVEDCYAARVLEVGQLDIFCNEDIAYALKLSQAGIPAFSTVQQSGGDRCRPTRVC